MTRGRSTAASPARSRRSGSRRARLRTTGRSSANARKTLPGLPAGRATTLAQVLRLVRLQANVFTQAALARALLDARLQRALPEEARPAGQRHRRRRPARRRLSRRLGLRAPVPSARERRRAERPRRGGPDEAGEGARRGAHRPHGPPQAGRGVGVLLPVRRRFAAVDVRHGAGRRRPGARPRGEDDSGAAGVRVDSRAARPASRRGPVDPALRLQQSRRPQRAAPDDSLAPRVRGDVGEQARESVRHESRQDGTSEAVRVRHRLLVALLAGPGVVAVVPRVRRLPPREARAAHRPEGLAGQARPLRRLHRPGAGAQEGRPAGAVLSLAE